MFYQLFSRRKERAEKSGNADVYQYDSIPAKLRVQAQQILRDAIGPQYRPDPYDFHAPQHNAEVWQMIHRILLKEFGVHNLTGSGSHELANADILNFLSKADAGAFIDTVEVCCRAIEKIIGEWPEYRLGERGIEQKPTDAIEEINYRMREAGLGYCYVDGMIIRLDSEFSHEQVVKPALRLLRQRGFEGPQAEFLQAHAHYRAKEYNQAITEAAKSFESMLKAICEKKGWRYEKGSRVTDLLKRVRAEGIWPDYLDNSFDQLLATLSSGLPKVRNEDGAHGQGATIRTVPDFLAAYALNLAAAKIVLVSEAAST